MREMTFEQALRDLTEIVEKIETGQVPLQESLQQYEKGMALIGRCRDILEEAEKRITEIEGRYTSGKEQAPAIEEDQEDEAEDREEELF